MKIVAINGSPHGNVGTTGMMLAQLANAAQDAGADVTTLTISDHAIARCRACEACHKMGVCMVKDDFPLFRDEMLAADGIVLASPNYINSVTAQIKALIDRSCGPLHCLALQGKYAAAIVTSGGGDEQVVQEYLLRYLRLFGAWTVGAAGASAPMLFNPATRPQALKAAADLGMDLVDAIASQRTYPQQVPDQEAFAQRMKMLVSFRKNDWPFEHEYWKSKGWL